MNAAQAHEVGAGATNGTPPASATRPALRVAHEPAQALTHAQRAAVAAFAPSARKLALAWLRQRPRHLHLLGDAEGQAYEAACLAATRWDGVRPFAPLASTYIYNSLCRWLRLTAYCVTVPANAIQQGVRNREEVSLSAPVGESGRATVGDMLEDEESPPLGADFDARRQLEAVHAHVLACWLAKCRRTEDAHRRTAAWWRYENDPFDWLTGEGITLQELGDELGVTRERVRQLVEQSRTFAREVRHG